jgi:hypothetical protein
MVSWCSGKQTFVALSIAEAEYIAICTTVGEAVWLCKLLARFLVKCWISVTRTEPNRFFLPEPAGSVRNRFFLLNTPTAKKGRGKLDFF